MALTVPCVGARPPPAGDSGLLSLSPEHHSSSAFCKSLMHPLPRCALKTLHKSPRTRGNGSHTPGRWFPGSPWTPVPSPLPRSVPGNSSLLLKSHRLKVFPLSNHSHGQQHPGAKESGRDPRPGAASHVTPVFSSFLQGAHSCFHLTKRFPTHCFIWSLLL